MRRTLLVLAALGLTSGVAAADRWHGEHRGGYVEHGRGSWSGGVHVAPTYRGGSYNHGGYYNRGGWHGDAHVYYGGYNGGYYARRPIYVHAPAIRYHYYNYYQRPSLMVENYPPMDGYTWVSGQWTWNGYEWIWQAGHYQPIYPSTTVYGDGYDGGGYGCPNGATDADCDGD